MQVSKVNFNMCNKEFDRRFDEIFLLKDSKLHFHLFGSNLKDGVVDGAKSKWKNIVLLDAIITIAIDQCPDGHRTLRRSFDQYKCLTHAIKVSLIDYQTDTKVPKVYDNIELYEFPCQFNSASNVSKLLLPNYRDGKTKLTRDHKKIMILFISQLKALLPENFRVNPKLKNADLLDHLIAKVDEHDLYFKAINKAIKISLEKEVDDFIVRHSNVIASLSKQKVSANRQKTRKSNKRRRSNSIDQYDDYYDDNHTISSSVSSSKIYEEDYISDHEEFEDEFTEVSNDFNHELDESMSEYDDFYDDEKEVKIMKYLYVNEIESIPDTTIDDDILTILYYCEESSDLTAN